MKIHSQILLILLFSSHLTSQVLQPVKWTTDVTKISGNEYKLIAKASIDQGWKLYSQIEPDGIGPLPTVFKFNNSDTNYQLIGHVNEPRVKPYYDKVFDLDILFFNNKVDFVQKIKRLNNNLQYIEATVEYMTCDDERCIPMENTLNFSLNGIKLVDQITSVDERSNRLSNKLNLNITGWDKYERHKINQKSNFRIFLLGLLGGLIALLTPCVFPLIPLTVSFFTKNVKNKKGLFNSILYGFFIFLIYFLLSLPFHALATFDPDILNRISTNIILNIVFFIIFIVFAFSFFGYFDLTLPYSWSKAVDNKINKIGGIIGIFFMALTLAIVSFSCTGPILGTLLGSSLTSNNGAIQLTMGMSGFGLALAIPFAIFAMFPKWLNALPKSGSWLNTVKIILGFIELALALKFLSNADLVEHWGLLKREIFIGLWILIGIGLVLYLFGKIKFPHDIPIQKLSKVRITTAFIFLAFVFYLLPGLTDTRYANLKLLSGFAPPLFYSVYEKNSDCPLDLNCYKNFEIGLYEAKKQDKPILLDFTGWACVNCRKMEEHVWSTSEVFDILKNNYVIISLYVDDKKELPKEEQFKYVRENGTIKNIKKIGHKWAALQTINFKNNSQPYYVLLNHNMELLNVTSAYEPKSTVYLQWLKKGVENFKKKNTKFQYGIYKP